MKINIIKQIHRYRGNRWLPEGRAGGRREIREGSYEILRGTNFQL